MADIYSKQDSLGSCAHSELVSQGVDMHRLILHSALFLIPANGSQLLPPSPRTLTRTTAITNLMQRWHRTCSCCSLLAHQRCKLLSLVSSSYCSTASSHSQSCTGLYSFMAFGLRAAQTSIRSLNYCITQSFSMRSFSCNRALSPWSSSASSSSVRQQALRSPVAPARQSRSFR